MSILDAFNLSGKVALVTGANRGLGQAMAAGLAEAGADIVGLNRNPDPGQIRQQAELLGRRFFHCRCDLGATSVKELQEIVEKIVLEMGRLDILVNNASALGPSPQPELKNYPLEVLRQVYETNVLAPLALIQDYSPSLQKHQELM